MTGMRGIYSHADKMADLRLAIVMLLEPLLEDRRRTASGSDCIFTQPTRRALLAQVAALELEYTCLVRLAQAENN